VSGWLSSPVFICLVAFALRIFVVILRRTYLFPYTDGQFAGEIGRVAVSIMHGEGFSSPYGEHTGATALVSPVYAYFLAALFKIFGAYSLTSAWIALAFDSACSALTCWTVMLLGRRTFGWTVGVIAAWAWAVSPFAIHASSEYVWETCLSTLLFSVAFVMAVRVDGSWSRKRWMLFGCLWGLIALTNTALVSVFPFLLVWMMLRARGTWRGAGLALVATIVCVSPWLIRNLVTFHGTVLLRSGLGNELYNATLLDTPVGRGEVYGVIESREEVIEYRRVGELAYMAERGRLAREIIGADPGHFLFLCVKRVAAFWAGNWASFEVFRGKAMLARFALYAALSVVGLIGLGVAWYRGPYALLYTIPLVVYPGLYYLTHVEARYRHPIEPFLVILAVYVVAGRNRGSIRKLG
jgi:hypothetical protein